MTTGTVASYNASSGYGFVTPDDGGKDVFCHASVVQRSSRDRLREGDRITFEIGLDPRSGKRNVSRIETAR
jgi:cold shock protein